MFTAFLQYKLKEQGKKLVKARTASFAMNAATKTRKDLKLQKICRK